MNKRVIYLSVFLILALFIISACKQQVRGVQISGVECLPGQQIGDVDGDGQITSYDASLANQIANGIIPEPNNICCIDANNDKSITSSDASQILQIVVGNLQSPGTCVETPPTTCADSDGGKNYYVKGVSEGITSWDGNKQTVLDVCQTNVNEEFVFLDEYYCSDNKINVERYTCPNGCKDGACISDKNVDLSVTDITYKITDSSFNDTKSINFYITIKNEGNKDINETFIVGVGSNPTKEYPKNGFGASNLIKNEVFKSGAYKKVYINGAYLIKRGNSLETTITGYVDLLPPAFLANNVSTEYQNKIKEDDETNNKRSQYFLINTEVTYQGVLDMLNKCDRAAIYVNVSDPFWSSNPHPTGNSLCQADNKICVTAMLSESTLAPSSPPNEWGENTNSGLWPCSWDATSVYGRSSWKAYKLDAICCSP
ncbi:MAG: dockerin type I repeat-containing protein [Nanoarchaeota archaeon]